MPCRDFFAFCTSLTKVELRAIGALSHVRHLADGDTIYRPTDAGDTLYIVNRGVVELSEHAGHGPACLKRGDIFGEAEALAGTTRRHRARTFEPTSLQCFPRNNFPALAERVPTFFQYVCEELATRLLAARDSVWEKPTQLELSGSLTNFDLVTVYQTIVNSSQTGELSISTEKGELICTFFFESGQPRSGQFQHLVGEEAFWQLFLADDLRGTFSFASDVGVVTPSIRSAQITRSPNDMLITALQSRDEFHALKLEVGDGSCTLERNRSQFDADNFEPIALRSLAGEIWQFRPRGELRLQDLFRHLSVCEMKIYQALHSLMQTGHISVIARDLAQKVA
ncbi:MAG: cyclic nucleotide-binding domain-containing protein [Verrucomicrobiota bacterium]|nr:cyclic nucleotide-binding domain-containing protein [Verrucomicrobiota bacterium]